jgi:RNA polymerase sigma-54 factor
MSIGPRLELRQSQQLVMTPQLQQAIKLLQMTNLELSDYVDTELEHNPLLELGGDAESLRDAESDGPDGAALSNSLSPADTPFDGDSRADGTGDGLAYASPLSGAIAVGGRSGGGFDRSELGFDDMLAETASLLDHLDQQISLIRASPEVLAVARAIAADLDESGFFRSGLEETAARLGIETAVVAEGLAIVQSCDPTGIGARDLKGCLALQLRERNRFDPAMRALVENIELMAKAEYPKLRAICNVDEADFAEMIGEIKALDPRPARAFTGGVTVTIAPDVFVRRGNIGAWIVELNTATLPRVLVNNSYAAEVCRSGDRATRSFISECQQNASWLVKSLAQRARTILKVSEEIVRQQDGFFAYGVRGLKPMTLKSVADAISMHESTVSRVTTGKFIATERGTFELKYFFTAAINATNGGEAFSSEAVRGRIAGMIAQEAPAKPLSDEKIANLLEQSGVNIARRTVAKYREAMNIPSSSQRKRIHAASI